MPENAPEFARQVINSNLDTTNIIESDDITHFDKAKKKKKKKSRKNEKDHHLHAAHNFDNDSDGM